jgi:hypothetical protein
MMSKIVIVILICHRHKSTDSINLLGSLRRRNVFPVRYGQTYRLEFYIKDRTMENAQNRDTLIYHRHNPT